MELKKVKTRYGGKCNKCQREINQGWDVYFSPETKAVYCTKCAEVMQNNEKQNSVQVPENIELTSKLDDMFIKFDILNTYISVMSEHLTELTAKLDRMLQELSKK